MKKPLFRFTTSWLCSLALLYSSAGAASPYVITTGASSALSVASGVSLVVSGPFLLYTLGWASGAEDFAQGERRNIEAGPIPDMRVIAVEHTGQGSHQVALADPSNPENKAMLSWTERQDDPTAQFVVGQHIAFVPSPQGAGWVLRAESGAALAFVPTATAIDDSHSQTM